MQSWRRIKSILETTLYTVTFAIAAHSIWTTGLAFYEIWDTCRTSLAMLPDTIRDAELEAVVQQRVARTTVGSYVEQIIARNDGGRAVAFVEFNLPVQAVGIKLFTWPCTITVRHKLGGRNWKGQQYEVPKIKRSVKPQLWN